jgi:Glycosyltransferase family 9 (heptosyltransferase)
MSTPSSSIAIFLHLRHHGPLAIARILSILPASCQRFVLTAPALAAAIEPVAGTTIIPVAESWNGAVPDLPALIRSVCDPAIERVVLGCDDGLLVLPETLPAGLESDVVGIFSGPSGRTDPLYALSNFSRPDDYLTGGTLSRAGLDLLDGIVPFRFDRWLGHRLALAAARQGRSAVLLKSGFTLLPAPSQCSGADVGLTRSRAHSVLTEALAAVPALPMGEAWCGAAARAIEHIPAVTAGTFGMGQASDAVKSEIDQVMSTLTERILSSLPAATEDAIAWPPARRLAFLGIETIDEAVPLLGLMRSARDSGVTEIRFHALPAVLDALRECPGIDAVLPGLDVTSEGQRLFLSRHPEQVLERELPALADFLAGVDTVILPSREVDRMGATALAVLAGVKRRIGFSETGSPARLGRNRGFDGAMTDVIPAGGDPIASLAELLGCEPQPPDLARALALLGVSDDETAVERWLEALAGRDGPLLVLAPGACRVRRSWTTENFVTLAAAAREHCRARILVVGSGRDALRTGAGVRRALGVSALDLTGGTNLPQLYHLLKAADLCIGNQNYVTEIASAAGCPSVVVSCHPIGAAADHPDCPPQGSTRIVVRPQAAVVASCHSECRATIWPHCIVQITADRVLSEIQGLLEPGIVNEG